MPYPAHLEAFDRLGRLFNKFSESVAIESDPWLVRLKESIALAEVQNGWFTEQNCRFAIAQWGSILTTESLLKWTAPYEQPSQFSSKTIAIIMAGNIPLVGFHDFVTALISGHGIIAKLSSNDKVLLPFIVAFLESIDATLKGKIRLTQERLSGFDAVIATGSNNTGRYFEHYFGKYPNIIRKNRSSVAILTGNESERQLKDLGLDIFGYFGLGCRSVSKLFVPKGYRFDVFFKAIFDWGHLLQHHKYVNNYDYNKAVYLMSDVKLLDNEFLLLKEDLRHASPIGTLFFEYYEDIDAVRHTLKNEASSIQCVVAQDVLEGEIAFGHAQRPQLGDYADNIDTMTFLLQLS